MSNKWNKNKAQSYAEALSNLLCDQFFENQDKISGSEILKFTEVKQLNLLIVKELYDKWLQETAKVKSPYFDFEHEEVAKAFNEFKNILSRYILVEKTAFNELLRAAIYKTLELNMSTGDYFEQEMRSLPEFKLTKDWLKMNGKYYPSHAWVLTELLNRKRGLPVVYANQAIDWVKEILGQKDPKMPNNDLSLLHDILPLEWSEEESQLGSFFDDDFDMPIVSKPTNSESLPVEDSHSEKQQEVPETVKEKVAEKLKNIPTKESVLASTKEAVVEPVSTLSELPAEVLSPKIKEPLSLNDKHLGSQSTLNERIVTESRVSLSDNHSKGKIESISSSISLNQRFLFINNLFGGNVQAFTGALDQIEAKNSFVEAKDVMIKNYMPNYKWDVTSPEAEEFFEILKRRFS